MLKDFIKKEEFNHLKTLKANKKEVKEEYFNLFTSFTMDNTWKIKGK